MKTPALAHSSVEPLEARIAPALLVHGANLLGGAGNPSSGETSVGEHSVTLVKVTSGQAIVWFDGITSSVESISFGPNTSLEVTGDIVGDLVGNLRADGTLSDSDSDPINGWDGSRLLANNLTGLKTLPLSGEKGSLGNIITGGSIGGLSINGEIKGVYAGDGVFRPESDLLSGGFVSSSVSGIDINPIESGTQSTFTFAKSGAELRPGASIAGAKITSAPALQIIAGNGNPAGTVLAGAGPAGGSVTGITIENAYVPAGSPTDTPSYTILAGDGASGRTGGAGGSIDRIVEKASSGPVLVQGGAGGDATGGAGGAGGSVSNLDLQSNSARYTVNAGDGGDGAPAGAGGKLANNNFSNRTPVSGIVRAADFTGDGRDDVLVIDAATGQMMVSAATGATFTQVVQYSTGSGDVVLIDSMGANPVDAEVRDLDGDNDVDVLVAYKNSNELGVFLNQGNGSFFNLSLGAGGEFDAAGIGLGFAPAHITAAANGTIGIAENTDGKGILRYGNLKTGGVASEYSIELSTGSNEFSQPVADLVNTGGDFYAGFSNGVLARLQTASIDGRKAFTVFETNVAIPGGINDLEIDSTGNRLLALSTVSRTVSILSTANSTLTPLDSITLGGTGKSVVAHFLHDADAATEDAVAVLTTLPSGTRIDSFEPAPDDGNPLTVETFSAADTLTTPQVLKNFAGVYADAAAPAENLTGLVGLAGSMSQFTFTPDYVTTTAYALPFASKQIELRGGDGGTGLNLSATLIGKGGAGGSVAGINADGNEIRIYAGDGGASGSGAAGAGGSIVNAGSFVTASGATVVPALLADVLLSIEAGDGGTAAGPEARTASGGAGGSVGGLRITLEAGDITLGAGSGGDGRGGNGGAGGGIADVRTLARDGSLALSTGDGGDAAGATGLGGAGGSIATFFHELALEADVESLEKNYNVTIGTGDGGAANGGAGGAGGSIVGVSLKLDGADKTYDDSSPNPPLVDAHKDSTVAIGVSAGDGGRGATGGAGGAIRDLRQDTVHDQLDRLKLIRLNYVTMQLTAGDGGQGTAGAGGAGGAIAIGKPISGITGWDPDAGNGAEAFAAFGGVGGDGSTKGGAGGSVSGITLQNAPFVDGSAIAQTQLHSAIIVAGRGGAGGSSDGGAGGGVSKLLVGARGGMLTVGGGDGGAGGARGGAGGAVSASTLGLVITTAQLGLLVQGGDGGDGTTGGGAGGALSTLSVSTPQSTNGVSAILSAGAGGAANSASGVGGKGGGVTGIAQIKDVNSSINAIAAGTGGDNPLGKAGAGGNVAGVKTVGFIGRPSDGVDRLGVFDQINAGGGNFITIPQGVFAGAGGQGATDGVNGSVSAVTARQIAAISAINAATGAFVPAAKVSAVKAGLIGFDVDADGVFDSTVGGASPTAQTPIDGFILAAAIQQVNILPPASFIFAA